MTPCNQEFTWAQQLRKVKDTKKATGQVFKGGVKDYRDNTE